MAAGLRLHVLRGDVARREAHTMNLESRVKWMKPIGIELTFVLKRGSMKDSTRHVWSNTWRSKKRDELLDALWDDQYGCYGSTEAHRISTDPGCVEWPSPILRSWEEACDWYHMATGFASQFDLAPFRQNVMGGGGHIHMGGLPEKVKRNMFRDMAFRPYVSWALIDPNDDINAKAFLSNTDLYNYNMHVNRLNPSLYRVVENEYNLKLHKRKFFYEDTRENILSVRHGIGTVEWRAFDSAADWEIQAQQIAIYQRYAALFLTRKIDVLGFSEGWMQYEFVELLQSWRNLDKCIRAFREFIESDLELPWKDYAWFVERNLEPKFKNKWSELV